MATKKVIQSTGKRKTAIARVTAKPGNGMVKINNKPLDYFGTNTLRLRIREPLVLSGDLSKKYDFNINVEGGGVAGQSEAVRQGIAVALVNASKGKSLEETFLNYDRNMLISDPRRTEPHKPSQSSKGPRHRKQFSKR